MYEVLKLASAHDKHFSHVRYIYGGDGEFDEDDDDTMTNKSSLSILRHPS